MMKKLLFASMLTIFSVLSTMAQTYNLFIGETDSLFYEWSKTVDGFKWNNTAKDSVGAITSGGPYEGTTHYEFNYNFGGWWCSGAWVLSTWDDVAQSYPGNVDLSGYTHLKLYWKGFSAQNPGNTIGFQFSDAIGAGPSVAVCDNSNNPTYVQKIIPLSSFVGATLSDLTAVQKITFVIADGAGNWWESGGASSGVWYMDAMQFVSIPDSMLVEGNGFAAVPGETYDFGEGEVGGTATPTTFNISNVKTSATLTLSGTPVISGANASDFTVTTNPSSSIAAGTSETFTITFNPGSVGIKTATLTITNNFSTGGSYAINLTGEAVDNILGVSHSAGSDSYAAYPTPFADETVIKINSTVNAPMNIKVMDTKGTVVSTSEGHFTNEDITLGKGLEKGMYFVQVAYQNRIQVIKIVKM